MFSKGNVKKILAVTAVAAMVVTSMPGIYAMAEEGVATESFEEILQKSEVEEVTTEEDSTEEIVTEKSIPEEATTEETTIEVTVTEEITTEEFLLSYNDGIRLLAENNEDINLPTEVKWADKNSAEVSFKLNDTNYNHYVLYFIKDGQFYTSTGLGSMESVSKPNYVQKMYNFIDDEGSYAFQIGVFKTREESYISYDELIKSGDAEKHLSALSDEFVYVKPERKLATPTNIKETFSGVFVWDAVEAANTYKVKLGDENGNICYENYVSYPEFSLANCNMSLSVGQKYKLMICSHTDEITKALDSDEATFEFVLQEKEDKSDVDVTIHQYVVPSELKWGADNVPWNLSFKVNDDVYGYYIGVLYVKTDRGYMPTMTAHFGDLSSKAGTTHKMYLGENVAYENGDYVVRIFVFGSKDADLLNEKTKNGLKFNELPEGINAFVTDPSPVYTHNVPYVCQTVKNVTWSTDTFGLVTWEPVSGASRYAVNLLSVSNENQEDYKYHYEWTDYPSVNLSKYMQDMENRYYLVQIQTRSGDYANYLHSKYSSLMPCDYTANKKAVDEAKEKLNGLTVNSGSSKEDVKSAVDDVKETYKDNITNLQTAMQTDSEVLNKVSELENLYNGKNGITTNSKIADELSINTEDVTIIGAGLNAEPNSTVTFNIEKAKPEEEQVYNRDIYKNAVQFSLDLSVNDSKVTELKIPVTVTLPIPEGMDVSKLVILHAHTNDNGFDTIYPKISADKNKMTFTVTHFSTFVFAEQNDAPINNYNSNNNTPIASTSSSSASIAKGINWNITNILIDRELDKITASSTDTAVVRVYEEEAAIIPTKTLEKMAGKKVILSVALSDKVVINIDGTQLDKDAKMMTARLSYKEGKLKVLTSNIDTTRSITVFSKMSDKVVGTKTKLNFVDADGKLIPFRESIVFENGYTAFVTPFVGAVYTIE